MAIDLKTALQEAIRRFASRDPAGMAVRAGARFTPANGGREAPTGVPGGALELPFLGTSYLVTWPDGKVAGPRGEPPVVTRILLLHYLYQAEGLPPSGRYVSFRELPGGDIYIGPYTQRVIRPLVHLFGNRPQDLVIAAGELGGRPEKLGDAAVTIPALPWVPVTYVLWAGDDELPANGNVLYDETISFHLPTEDVVVLTSEILWLLKANLARRAAGDGAEG